MCNTVPNKIIILSGTFYAFKICNFDLNFYIQSLLKTLYVKVQLVTIC
jgi:hypothetical protein